MEKILLIIGILIILYTILARVTGIPLITDFLPVDLFSNKPNDSNYFKVVESNKPSSDWLYTILVGLIIFVLGGLAIYFKKG